MRLFENKEEFNKELAGFLDRGFHNDTTYMSFIDLNAMKIINDTYGHSIGDSVIKRVMEIIQESRKGGFFLHHSGDEFVLAHADEGEGYAELFISKLQSRFKDDYVLKTLTGGISASAGTVKYDKNLHKTPKDLIDAADKLMYTAKKRPPSFRTNSWEPEPTERRIIADGSRTRAYFDWITTALAKEYPGVEYSRILTATRSIFEHTDMILEFSPKLLFSLVIKELLKNGVDES